MWASFAIKNEETMHSEPPKRKLYPWAQYGVKVRFFFAWHEIFNNISTFSHFKRKWTSSEELCAEFKVFKFWKNWLQCSSVKPSEAWFSAKISFVSLVKKILHTLKFPFLKDTSEKQVFDFEIEIPNWKYCMVSTS